MNIAPSKKPKIVHLVQNEIWNKISLKKRNRGLKLAGLALLLIFATASSTAFSASHDIYPTPSEAQAQISAALKSAAATHKRVILDFGGNWCEDCYVLDHYFEDASNKPILDANFIVVHVNIGYKDANLNIAARYHVPVNDGVPALAVLSDHGKLLFSQETGEFKRMRHMESSSVTSFLVQWKPVKPGCSAVQITC